MFTNLKAKLAGLFLSLAAIGSAQAVPITYEFWGTGSGRLGSSSFVDTAFRITAVADTDAVSSAPSGYSGLNSSASVWVATLGEALFSNPTIMYDNQTLSRVGISSPSDNRAILFVDNGAFSSYGLTSAIGPLTGSTIFNNGFNFATTLGAFAFTSVQSASFQATVSPVPEPSSVALMGVGALVLIARMQKRRKNANKSA